MAPRFIIPPPSPVAISAANRRGRKVTSFPTRRVSSFLRCASAAPAENRPRAVQCLYCRTDLTIRRWTHSPPSPEPWITAFERVAVEALAGKAPDPAWGGDLTASSFRGLLADLVWMLTTNELSHPSL